MDQPLSQASQNWQKKNNWWRNKGAIEVASFQNTMEAEVSEIMIDLAVPYDRAVELYHEFRRS